MDKQESLIVELKKYKGVIYDLDGTLADLNVDWQAVKKELSMICKIELNIDIEFTPLNKKMLEVKAQFGDEVFNKLLSAIEGHEGTESNYKLNDSLIEYINSSTQPFGIYSMNSGKTVANFVSKYLKRVPAATVTASTCTEPKPSGKDLPGIVQKLGISKEDVVYVGNTSYDQESGSLSSIKTIII